MIIVGPADGPRVVAWAVKQEQMGWLGICLVVHTQWESACSKKQKEKNSHFYISSKYAEAQEKLPMGSVKTSPLSPFIKICIETLSFHTYMLACYITNFLVSVFSAKLKSHFLLAFGHQAFHCLFLSRNFVFASLCPFLWNLG